MQKHVNLKTNKLKNRKEKKINITFEILEPGTLKRRRPNDSMSTDERWCEIVEIGSEIIAENDCDSLPN